MTYESDPVNDTVILEGRVFEITDLGNGEIRLSEMNGSRHLADQTLSIGGRKFRVFAGTDGRYLLSDGEKGYWSDDRGSEVVIDGQLYDIILTEPDLWNITVVPRPSTSAHIAEQVIEIVSEYQSNVTRGKWYRVKTNADGTHTFDDGLTVLKSYRDKQGQEVLDTIDHRFTVTVLGSGEVKLAYVRPADAESQIDYYSVLRANEVIRLGGLDYEVVHQANGTDYTIKRGTFSLTFPKTQAAIAVDGADYTVAIDPGTGRLTLAKVLPAVTVGRDQVIAVGSVEYEVVYSGGTGVYDFYTLQGVLAGSSSASTGLVTIDSVEYRVQNTNRKNDVQIARTVAGKYVPPTTAEQVVQLDGRLLGLRKNADGTYTVYEDGLAAAKSEAASPTTILIDGRKFQVQNDDRLIPQDLRDFSLDNHLRESLDNSRFPDAGFSQQDRIIFGAAAQDLQDPLGFFLASYDRVQLPFLGQLVQITAVRVDGGRFIGLGRFLRAIAGDTGAQQFHHFVTQFCQIQS